MDPIPLTRLECKKKVENPLNDPSRITLTLDSRVYRLTAIKKAAYRFIDRFAATMSVDGDQVICVLAFTAPALSEQCRSAIVADFMKELLDQDLREQIRIETEPVRNLVFAYAFSKTGIEPDE